MLKPLLRTIPTMSGNVKLACNLLDYKYNGDNEYETDIRYAKILPLSSTLYQRKIETQLLGSSWEYDLKKFYDIYNDVFFDPYFKYNTEEILKIDKTINQYVRNTDFEMGVKRVSYVKNHSQFAYFAPFYFEKLEDLPAYFYMAVNIHTTVHKIVKKIKINIANNINSKGNHLYHYLKKYASKLDSNVCFMLPDSKQASYYGIDLVHGGFVKVVDNGISNIYNIQTTINNVDATICTGFKRNKIAMKQVMPLAFYFNVKDFMTPSELKLYRNAKITFSGYYVNQDGIGLPWYDFNIDYDFLSQDVLRLNTDNGIMQWVPGNVNNIMDMQFPSLNDKRYIKYQFSNKLTSTYCRWKLKYSTDEHPYITNMSPAFSKNQHSNYKYGQYPVSFSSMDGLALPMLTNNAYYYNLIFPLSTNVKYYNLYNSNSATKYVNIFNNYCLNWFNVIDNVNDDIFKHKEYWLDVEDNCVYYNGILYDLSNIYSELVDPEYIDKFAMFININSKFMDEFEVGKLVFSNFVLHRQVVDTSITSNALSNLQLLNWGIDNNGALNYKNYLWDNEEYRGEVQNRGNKDNISFNEIFTYSEDNTGTYINILDYGMDYYELNKYYDANQVISYINNLKTDILDKNVEKLITYADFSHEYFNNYVKNELTSYIPVYHNQSSYVINSYELLDIPRSYYISYEFPYKYRSYDKSITGYQYGLNLQQYEAYEYVDAYNNVQYSYHVYPIEGKYDKNGLLEPGSDYEYEYLKEILYMSNIDNHGIKSPSFNTYNMSYFAVGKPEYINSLYGNTFYNKRRFIKASDINLISYEPFSVTYIKPFCTSHANEGFDYSIVNNPTTSAYKLWKTCQHTQELIGELLNAYLKTIDIYEFNPVLHTNEVIYSDNVFKKRHVNSGKFYGDIISYSELQNDKDVIYADRYNLNAILDKYTKEYVNTITYETESGLTYSYTYLYELVTTYNITRSIDDDYTYTHIHKSKLPDIYTYTYNADGTLSNVVFNDKNYSEFYCKFLNKLHIYYYYGEIVKDEKLEYPENWAINWKKNVYIKRRTLVHTNTGLDVKDEYVPVVEAGYLFAGKVDPSCFMSFKTFYSNLLEDENNPDLFYFAGNDSEKFELVYKDIFYRVDKTLWDIIGCEDVKYKDIYLFRISKPIEFDNKYSTTSNIRFISNDVYNTYSSRYVDTDSSLCPLFQDVYEREELEELVYANYKLNNISPVKYEYASYEDSAHEHISQYNIEYNYRYNTNDQLMMVNITDDERKRLNITKTYNKYSYCNSKYNVYNNDLNYNDSLHMSTYKDPVTGKNYGFYVIDVYVDNTSNTFRIDGQTSLESKSLQNEIYDYVNNVKSIYYINGINIIENPDYFTILFKNILPFMKLNLLSHLNELSTIIKPNSFNINMIYNLQLIDNTNGSNEINIYKNDESKPTIYNLYRYTHNIVPYITKRSILSNVYRLKLKNVDKTILDTGKFTSIGDSVIYSSTNFIDSFTPYNVYTLSDDEKEIRSFNNIDYKYTPLEYKHFNDSNFINLEDEIIIKLDGKFTYDELIDLETEEQTVLVFNNYQNTGRVTKFTDSEILFLYNKYKVEYDTKSIGLSFDRKEKLYSLSYKFSLL